MRNTVAIAILLTAISSAPVLSQAKQPVPAPAPMPAAPEITAPAAPEPPTGWTASVVKTAPPVVDVPVPELAKAPVEPRPAAPSPSEAVQAWAAKEAASAPHIQYVNRERNELVARMEARKIFVYTPVGPDGVAVVPEPSSIMALAYGIAGVTVTLIRRRKKVQF